MKIRTQLILAFLFLAIVPLSAIVLFSYVTSLRAVRSAVAEETRALTEEMDGRMASIRNDLATSFARLGQFPFRSLSGGVDGVDGKAGAEPLFDELLQAMGDSARLVQSLEFVPTPPDSPPEAAPEALDGAPPVPSLPSITPGMITAKVLPGASDDGDGQGKSHIGAVVIDVPRILKEIEAAERSRAAADGGPSGADPAEDRPVEREAAIGLAVEVLGKIAAGLAEESSALEEKIRRAEESGAALPESQRQEMERALEDKQRARAAVNVKLHEAIETRRRMTDEEQQALEDRQRTQRLLFGREFQVPVEEEGKVVGHVTACVAGEALLADVLERSTRGSGEVPFAIDRDGNLYTAGEDDREVVESLGLQRDVSGRWQPAEAREEWVVGASADEGSGLTFGVARPIRRSIAAVRATAARNFGVGLGLIVLGLVGIQPLARRMTRHLDAVTRGAERIARGDLQTRLPVRSKSEFGQLALAFNRMAEDLSHHQEREMQQRLVQAELERKSLELEEARRFQLSLLPRCVPEHPGLDLAVAMTTATEVGGDFYDFYTSADGRSAAWDGDDALTVAVGDATGHGARAGTMVTVVKSLLIADTRGSRPAEFLCSANRAIRRMELQRMTMALCMARFEGRTLTVASAGMPPVLVHRGNPQRAGAAEAAVEEIALPGMPLGGLDETYRESTVELAPGDTVLLLSDGLPELPNRAGDPLGYVAVRDRFAQVAGSPPEEIIRALEATARAWAGDSTPADDMTFVVARVRAA